MGRRHGRDYAVIGLGRFGASVARTLALAGHSVLGIDKDAEVVQQLSDELTQTVAMDGTDEDALREIDIASFDAVIVGMGESFEANLLTTVSLKEVGVRRVVCKPLSERQRVPGGTPRETPRREHSDRVDRRNGRSRGRPPCLPPPYG